MVDTGTGPRGLLRRLREVMAETLGAQDRLDKIVRHIAANMVAEVCSVYVLRADGVLELFATEGLNPQSVHEASLMVGQGLVGSIAATARTLNLEDAQNHPSFRYLPETGEEIYHSFLGVPILRSGRALGVLVVQNQEKRAYREDEVEALETTAMVLAELVAGGELEGLVKQGGELDSSRQLLNKRIHHRHHHRQCPHDTKLECVLLSHWLDALGRSYPSHSRQSHSHPLGLTLMKVARLGLE